MDRSGAGYRFSSFAAPTKEDRRVFDALPAEEQAAIIEAEIAKGFEGESVIVTDATAREIRVRVLRRIAQARK
jgi:hypothetical protein